MLTKADDYPIHQTPEPIAYSGSDRNFYDRYFFNGYSKRDGELFFAAALGVYPHLNVMDASFCVIVDGVQKNVHASKTLHMERLDTQVGPIEIEVIEPLEVLRVIVDDAEHGIRADVRFRARVKPVEEPRFTRRTGTQLSMDYTRLTQNGVYSGWVEVQGRRFDVSEDNVWGTRDRSWGIRPVGERDPQPNPYATEPQFYWLWAPVNFDDRCSFYHINADADGEPWNERGVMSLTDGSPPEDMRQASSQMTFTAGSRHAASASVSFTARSGAQGRIQIEPLYHFYMRGLGYGHPEWGHGAYHGELASGYDEIVLSEAAASDPQNLHIQAVSRVTLEGDLGTATGTGVLEQLIIGPHAPSGFTEILDMAE
jgi:hypothetical protein